MIVYDDLRSSSLKTDSESIFYEDVQTSHTNFSNWSDL